MSTESASEAYGQFSDLAKAEGDSSKKEFFQALANLSLAVREMGGLLDAHTERLGTISTRIGKIEDKLED